MQQRIMWTALLAGLVDGDDPVAATLLGDAPDPGPWTGLFAPDTPVRPPEHADYTGQLW